MNYTDAKEFLRIADMAYDTGDYQNAADIVERVARFAAYDSSGLTQNELYDLTRAVKHSIARFTDCPDEAIWEEASALGDMFRK